LGINLFTKDGAFRMEKIDDVEVFNNGRGWRISISLNEKKTVLTKSQGEVLVKKMQVALSRITDKNMPD
jgi:hypothetical protein